MSRSIMSERARNNAAVQRVRDMIRRVDVKVSGAFWQLLGYEDDEGNKETFEAVEPFQGIGFSSRPKEGNEAEAIVANLGRGRHSIAVAMRDKSFEVVLDDDETAVFNTTGAKVHFKKDGSISGTTASGKKFAIDDGAGDALPLPTLSDVTAIITAITNAVPLAQDGGLQFKNQILAALRGIPVGTTVLEGK